MSEKIDVRPATIVIENDKVLVVESKYGEEEFYLFPGGGIEYGETIEETAIRETLEETGYQVKVIKPVYINEYIDERDKSQRVINIFFLAKLTGKERKKACDDGGKIKQVRWVPIKKLKEIDIRPRMIKENLEKDYKEAFKIVRYNIEYKHHRKDVSTNL